MDKLLWIQLSRLEPPEETIPSPACEHVETIGGDVSSPSRYLHPIDDPRELFLEMIVSATCIQRDHGVDLAVVEHVVPSRSVEVHRVLAIELAVDKVGRHILGVRPILDHVFLGDPADDDRTCPHVWMCKG